MLKMKCSNCAEMIISPLLSDVETVICDSCQERVPVNDVLVCAEGFTFHRNDLIKRLFRYKTLLNEVGKEREMLDSNPHASAESRKSLDRFLQALEEVMAGARNNLRIDFAERLPIRFSYNGHIESGFLINLSMTGACIKIDRNTPHPSKKGVLALNIVLPNGQNKISLPGVVSWINTDKAKNHDGYAIGLKFKSLNDEPIALLWNFISTIAMAESAG